MKRWVLILVCGHILGSYGIEFVDYVDDYWVPVPAIERLKAPLSALPWLLRSTAAAISPISRSQAPIAGLIPFWIGYFFPWSLTLAFVVIRKSRRKCPGIRGEGFEPLQPDNEFNRKYHQ
jgi:hypothetical protein